MPWCPNCKSEYREGFDTCTDCGEPLCEDACAASECKGPYQPPSTFRCVVATTIVIVPLFCVSLIPWFLLIEWVEMNWFYLCLEQELLCSNVLAAALTGFATGALLHKYAKPFHVYLATTTLGVWLLVYILATTPNELGLPTVSEFFNELLVPFVILPQLSATLASSRGIAFGNGSRLKSLLWLVGLLAILIAAMLAMRPVFDLVSK